MHDIEMGNEEMRFTMAMTPTTLTLAGFKMDTVLKKPATSAAPHLSLDIPAMIPEQKRARHVYGATDES